MPPPPRCPSPQRVPEASAAARSELRHHGAGTAGGGGGRDGAARPHRDARVVRAPQPPAVCRVLSLWALVFHSTAYRNVLLATFVSSFTFFFLCIMCVRLTFGAAMCLAVQFGSACPCSALHGGNCASEHAGGVANRPSPPADAS